jgi:transcriptional antiterminator RfaH
MAKESAGNGEPARMFRPGERVRLITGPFAGIEGIYQMAEGERRVMVLIELMSKLVSVGVSPTELRKVG